MGMREIHDVVIRLSRRQDEIKNQLTDRHEQFRTWKARGAQAVAVRVTALPVSAPLYLDSVYGSKAVSRDLTNISGHWVRARSPEEQKEDFPAPLNMLSEIPILGGTAWTGLRSGDGRAVRQVIMRNGLIDLWFKVPWVAETPTPPRPVLRLGWIIALCANALIRVHAFRETAAAPSSEYALQVEFLSTIGPSNSVMQITYPALGAHEDFGLAFDTPMVPDLYPIRDDRDEVMNLIVRDLYDACAIKLERPVLKIDWPS